MSILEDHQTLFLMPQLCGTNRFQAQIICAENFIKPEDEVRVMDAFVEALELESFGFQMKGQSHEGRPAFHVKTLLKLYLFGYRNGIRSSRKLATACQFDLRLWWLLREQKPKFKTIADF